MLGIAQNAQRAGWGGGPLTAAFESTASFSADNYQTPAFSYSVDGNNRNWQVTAGSLNLTGYSSLTGYNKLKYTTMYQIYFVKDTYSYNPQSTSDYCGGTIYVSPSLSNNITYYDSSFALTNSNTQLQFTITQGAGTLTLPGSYTNYMNRWLTVIDSASNSYSSFSSWAGGTSTGTNYTYHRVAVYDTELNTLIGKSDNVNQGWFTPTGLLDSLPSSLYVNYNDGSGTQHQLGGFGSGGAPYENNHRLGQVWHSMGTMFDPLTETGWNTTRPPKDIGQARAWVNIHFTNSTSTGITQSGDDLYTPTSGTQVVTKGSSDWTEGYSTTIIPKDRS